MKHCARPTFAQEGREPTDVELESLAQTWSEHCGAQDLQRRSSIIVYQAPDGRLVTEQHRQSVIKTYLVQCRNPDRSKRPGCGRLLSTMPASSILATNFELSFKVETHNHPSALEPFGGANTGVGGVIRDVMGVSARPIANTDVLCFGPLDTPMDESTARWRAPSPAHLCRRRLGGVEDYGNKMGIPTVNGAVRL